LNRAGSLAKFISTRGRRQSQDDLGVIKKSARACRASPKTISPTPWKQSSPPTLLDNGADLRVIQEMLGTRTFDDPEIVYGTSISDALKETHYRFHPRSGRR